MSAIKQDDVNRATIRFLILALRCLKVFVVNWLTAHMTPDNELVGDITTEIGSLEGMV